MKRSSRQYGIILVLCAASAAAASERLGSLFSARAVDKDWKRIHCDLQGISPVTMRATFWKGYETTGFETTSLPVTDWSAWRSLRFEVRNPYDEPFSVYVRISDLEHHPGERTYTGGTFDGYVIAPGENTVQISLHEMRSPEEKSIDAKRIAYLGIFFAPLFLRDGQDLKFAQDKVFTLSNLRLDSAGAVLQRQPYAEPLFGRTTHETANLRIRVEKDIHELRSLVEQARARGLDTAYMEIAPFLAQMAFTKRLVAFWQNPAQKQRETLEFLQGESRRAAAEVTEILNGKRLPLAVPAHPNYGELQIRDGLFYLGDEPKLIFGMLYHRDGLLLRWFANSRTDIIQELVAGGTRHDVERQPIWQAYHQYPDTHRVGWPHADHIIRDRSSWEVLGEPVNVCLESPHSRAAIAQMIENFLRDKRGEREHLVLNMGYEYTYVCYCDYTRALWQEWLKGRHGSIEAANRFWKTSYSHFAGAPMPRPESAAANRALWFDWASFNLHRFLEQIRWTRDQVRRWEPGMPLTVGSPYYAFSPAFWTGIDEEELADSGINGAILEENYHIDSLQPEYLHAIAGDKPVMDFEHHGVIHQILPSFLHGDAAISLWWWNDEKQWTPNEPINEWASSMPQSYTISLRDVAKAMRDALDLRRLGREIAALGRAPRSVVFLYSKTSMLQHDPVASAEADTLPHLFYMRHLYNASQSAGVYVGFTTEKRILAGDLKNRKVLILPAAEFVPEAVSDEILKWVEGGGTLIVSPDSLLADEYARPTSVMEKLGLKLLRRQPPQLKRGEKIVTEYNFHDLPKLDITSATRAAFAKGAPPLVAAGARQFIETDPGRILARLGDGEPAIIHIKQGAGEIYWLTAPILARHWPDFLKVIALSVGLDSGLRVRSAQSQGLAGLEYRVIEYKGGRLAYFYNQNPMELALSFETSFPYARIVDRRTEREIHGNEFALPPHETAILEFR